MNNFNIIKHNNTQEWSRIINNSVNFDFYHTLSYNLLEKEGEPTLLVQTLEKSFIALPIIIRDIQNSNYKDCTSVYGYAGPITSEPFKIISKDLLKQFQDNMVTFFKENKIISCFSRLHPVFENYKILEGLGKTIDLNKTIVIDLNLPIDEQRRKYRKSNKYEINKLKKNDFVVTEAVNETEIDEFIDIYTDTMRRVNASDNYYFSRDYFYSFLQNDSFESKLLIAKRNNVITAGAIFTITNKLMQYHLAGTKTEYSRDTPMKLILDEARLLGNKLNLNHLHLGGGVGGSDEDSLYRFKSGFSDLNLNYKVWQFISNQEIYNQLVKDNNNDIESSFFPQYRA
ncbi:GNAT family N-acetyltransferase [uncultured Algibacter sp.]|uniref:GNAT family N-acetyltransferase n=1 Tax=uncultured Algibacter sp. TaxID=298659 RepID=UPI003217D1ED